VEHASRVQGGEATEIERAARPPSRRDACTTTSQHRNIAATRGERPLSGHPTSSDSHRSIPAIVAVSQEASAPPSIALSPIRASSDLRPGATAEIPPSWIPIDEKLAKPHRA